MRNFKKFLALVLATLMVISAAATVSAYSDVADDNTYAAAINALTEYKIVNGTNTELDTFSPDDDVVRYQMALMMARALEPKVTDWQEGLAVFTDVNEWYGAIAYAYTKGIVTGIGGGQFAPKMGIKYQDALIMAVRALGYEFSVTCDPYWIDAYKIASEIGLTKNVKVTEPSKTLTRAETAQVIYNMLKATPADGGATIEEKNFGVAGENNVTTFVITATPKQAYADSSKSVEAGFVGIQPLVNGIPNGAIMYIPASVLGIKDADVENYFNYAVDLVNYVEKTGKFDKAILGPAPTVVYSTDISVPSGTKKFVVDGTSYYPTSEFAGEALKNEIVVYNGGASAGKTRILLIDADKDIINEKGQKVAIFAYQAPDGTRYYADKLNSVVISEAKALESFGVEVEGSYTQYSTLEAKDLGSNYQLTMFDDDNDGKFERAIYTPVSMSVFTEPKDGVCTVIGPAKGDKDVKVVGDTLTKGNVFVYTYNKQLKTINVIEKLAVKNGKITDIDLTNYKSDKSFLATVKIDGETYKIGNSAQDSKMGASLKATTTDKVAFSKIAEGNLNYSNNVTTIENVVGMFGDINAPIQFIAFNGYIIAADVLDLEDSFEYMTIISAEDYDVDGVYVDAYVSGVRGTYHVTEFEKTEGNYVTFANLSTFKLRTEIDNFTTNINGTLRKVVVNPEDGSCKVSLAFDKTTDKDANGKLTDYNAKFKLYAATDELYYFEDGISARYNTKATRLRTNANTKFYFVNETDKTVSVFTGSVADKYSINTENGIKVFADKIGFGTNSSKNNVAGSVFVFFNNRNKSDIKGFNLSSITNTIVYVANPGTYTVGSAATFGLTGKSGTYYKYGEVAIDMSTGKKMVVYTAKKSLTRGFYEVDGAGIIGNAIDNKTSAEVIGGAVINKNNIDFADQYVTINLKNAAGEEILPASAKVSTVITVKSDDLTIKKDASYISDGCTIWFLNADSTNYAVDDTADGVVVLVVGTNTAPDPVKPTDPSVIAVANATYKKATDSKTYLATSTVSAPVAGTVAGKVTLYNVAGEIGSNITEAAKVLDEKSDKHIFTVKSIYFTSDPNTDYVKQTEKIGFSVYGTYNKGVLDVTKLVNPMSLTEFTLKKGYYGLEVELTASTTATIWFEVK